jgi:hypothetical protein
MKFDIRMPSLVEASRLISAERSATILVAIVKARMRRCISRKHLDLDTLVCTRGPNFPLSRLESRLMCPACGSHSITVVFEPPTNRQVGDG